MVWLSSYSEVQMICIRSSWCHCHPIISCFIKIQIALTFLVLAYSGCSGKEAGKRASVCLFRQTCAKLVYPLSPTSYWCKIFARLDGVLLSPIRRIIRWTSFFVHTLLTSEQRTVLPFCRLFDTSILCQNRITVNVCSEHKLQDCYPVMPDEATNPAVILLLQSAMDCLYMQDFPLLLISSFAIWKLTFLHSISTSTSTTT